MASVWDCYGPIKKFTFGWQIYCKQKQRNETNLVYWSNLHTEFSTWNIKIWAGMYQIVFETDTFIFCLLCYR